MVGVAVADQGRHRRGEDQDHGDHLEGRRDAETTRTRFIQPLGMKKQPTTLHLPPSASARVERIIFKRSRITRLFLSLSVGEGKRRGERERR